MIVDDDLDILNLLEDILSLKFPSIELEIAKNGSEALERLQELATVNPVDIVLSDMKMPVMNGAELCKLIKETYPDIKVALMTAFNETGSCFDEIFFKPIDFDALFNFIKNNWV
ncbi:MAG TPA: response regulator [Candidatus Lokiarchaeia archaeon]|nr:response regulator [Candidatus Lokiarchaeia archaeon]